MQDRYGARYPAIAHCIVTAMYVRILLETYVRTSHSVSACACAGHRDRYRKSYKTNHNLIKVTNSKMSSKATPSKIGKKRPADHGTAPSTPNSAATSLSNTPNKQRRQSPIELNVFFYNAVAVVFTLVNAYNM